MMIIKAILAIILPPAAVFLHIGIKDAHFWINIILSLVGYFPGLIHAIYILLAKEAIDMNHLLD